LNVDAANLGVCLEAHHEDALTVVRSAASAWACSPAPWSSSSWALPTPAIPPVP